MESYVFQYTLSSFMFVFMFFFNVYLFSCMAVGFQLNPDSRRINFGIHVTSEQFFKAHQCELKHLVRQISAQISKFKPMARFKPSISPLKKNLCCS